MVAGTNTVEWFDLAADITRVGPGQSVTVMSGLSLGRTGTVASVDVLAGLIVIDTSPADWPGIAAGDLIIDRGRHRPRPAHRPSRRHPPRWSRLLRRPVVAGPQVTWIDDGTADLSLVAPGQPVTVLDDLAIGLTGTVTAVDTTLGQITIDTGTDDWTGIAPGDSISIDLTPPPPPEPITEVVSVAVDGTYVAAPDAVVWIDDGTDLSPVAA